MVSVTLPTLDPNDPVLEDLCGINSVTTELGRQMFVRLWKSYNFRVKTFQESIIPSYQNPELRAETVSFAQTVKLAASMLTRGRLFADYPASSGILARMQRQYRLCTTIFASLAYPQIPVIAPWSGL
mgnify:CR=1 FL=1